MESTRPRDIAWKILNHLNEKGAGLGNASVLFIEKVLIEESAVEEVDKWISPNAKPLLEEVSRAIKGELKRVSHQPLTQTQTNDVCEWVMNRLRLLDAVIENDMEYLSPSAPKQDKEPCTCVMKYEFCVGDVCYFKNLNEQDRPQYTCDADCQINDGQCCHPDDCQKKLKQDKQK